MPRRSTLTSREIIIYAFNIRAPTQEAGDSELRYPRLVTTPLFLPWLSWAVLQRQRRKGKRGGGGGGWKRERRKKVERFIPLLFSRCVFLPLSLPPLLNLTIKQHCKNRMFLAEAQQWQSREGTGPYVKKKKKSPLFSMLSPKNVRVTYKLSSYNRSLFCCLKT